MEDLLRCSWVCGEIVDGLVARYESGVVAALGEHGEDGAGVGFGEGFALKSILACCSWEEGRGGSGEIGGSCQRGSHSVYFVTT